MDLSPDEDNFQGRLLHQAALWDNVELLQELLAAGADVNAQDALSRTALHAAALAERSSCLLALCSAGAHLDAASSPSDGGKTALHVAAERGHVENVRALLAAGTSLGAADASGDTALALAERHGHRHASAALREARDALERERLTQHAVLRELVCRGDVHALRASLQTLGPEAGLIVNLTPGGANTLLYVAAESGHTSVVSTLLDAGADGRAHPVTKYCPLYIACYRGHAETTRLLLAAYPHAAQQETVEKWLPLHAACIGGHPSLVTLLLEYTYPEDMLATYTDVTGQWRYRAAFDVNARDVSGQSALYVACTLGNAALLEALLAHSVLCWKSEEETPPTPQPQQQPASPTRGGISLGIHAIVSRLTRASKQDAEAENRVRPVRVDIGAPGDCCLAACTRGGHYRCAKLLLDAGADPDGPARPQPELSSSESQRESRRRPRSSSALPGRSSTSPSPCRTNSSSERELPWTPLAVAARNKHLQLLELLVSRGATDPACAALRECARHGLETAVARLLAAKAFPDPDYKINKATVSETVFSGRDGNASLTYSALCPTTPVTVNWRELRCQLAKIRMQWISEASLRVNPRLGSASAALHAVTRVDISNNELRALPVELFTLLSLRYLNVAQNKIERLPSALEPTEGEGAGGRGRRASKTLRPAAYSAPVLHDVYLQDNRLEQLPPELFALPSLTTLDVSNNKLRALPNELWTAPRLKELNASLNHLRELPAGQQVQTVQTDGASPSQLVSPSASSPQLSASPSAGNINQFNFNHAKSTSRSPSIERSASETSPEDDDDEDGVCTLGNRAGNAVWTEAKRVHTWRGVVEPADVTSSSLPGSNLTQLNISHNQFTRIPPPLACRAPRLQRLSMAYNSLRSMSYVTSYPTSLRQLDLSHNEITCWPSLPQLDTLGAEESPLNCYCPGPSARHRPRSAGGLGLQLLSAACPARRHLTLEGLRTLILSNNMLTRIQLTTDDDGYVSDKGRDDNNGEEDEWSAGSGLRGRLMFPLLSMLDVSCNLLRSVPASVHALTNLAVLNISGNRDITDLPPQMGLLSRLWNLNTAGCPLQEPLRGMVQCGKYRSMDIVGYLKSVLQEARPYAAMKLMLVGLQGIGKTSLLECLRQESAIAHRRKPTEHWAKRMGNKSSRRGNMSTVGVDIGSWVYEKHRSARGPVTFRTWDFGGQQEYYATHQYFLSRRSLYLVVWKVTDGRKGLAGALQWLRSIQARAPGSPVIMVATHYDQAPNSNLPESESPEVLQRIIRTHMMGAADADKLGLPRVLDSVEVSCSTRHNIRLLADIVYSVAFSVKPPGSKEPLLEQRVPATYLALEECVTQLASELKEPVLRHEEYKRLVTQYMQQKNHRMFRDAAELHQATMFLHENGVLLHYDDATLKELYFLRPQWLCDVLAHVVTIREINPFANNGIMKMDDLPHVFKASPMLARGDEAGSLGVSLLNKFELALCWDARSLLVPPLLPSREPSLPQLPIRSRTWSGGGRGTPRRAWPPAAPAAPRHEAHGTESPSLINEHPASINITARDGGRALRRILLLSYVPCGFWARLCTRLLADDTLCDCAPRAYSLPQEMDIDETTAKALELNWGWKLWKTGLKLACGPLTLASVRELPARRDELLGPGLAAEDEEHPYSPLRFRVHQEGVWSELCAQAQPCVELLLPAHVCIARREDQLPLAGYQSISLEPNPEVMAKLLALISDHVDLLLEDWYPSLGTRFVHTSEGRCLITRLVPCPQCLRAAPEPDHHHHMAQALRRLELGGGEAPRRIRLSQESRTSDGDSGVGAESNGSSLAGSVDRPPAPDPAAGGPLRIARAWTHERCILAACTGGALTCDLHGQVRLSDIAPDALLLDVEESSRARWEEITRGRIVGRGAFGTVLAATWRGRAGALKALQPVAPEPRAPARAHNAHKAAQSRWDREPAAAACRAYCALRQELSVLTSLRHTNVVQLMAVCCAPLALLLPLAPMGALDGVLREYRGCGARVGPRAARALALQVARALEYLHARRIVYRDLKSENVLVWAMPKPQEAGAAEASPAAINVHVKLGDYGISRLAPPSGTKGFGGTEGFMAPEIMRYNGEEEYNEKVDCFSFGMLLYEIISLRQPFEGHEAVKEAVLDGARPALSPRELQYPCHFLALMRQCWSGAPGPRPSAAALVSLCAAPEFTALQDAAASPAPYGPCAAAAALHEDAAGGWEVWLGGEERAHTLLAAPARNHFTHHYTITVPPENNEPVTVTAMCRVGARMWLGDSAGRVSVYSASTCALLWRVRVSEAVGGAAAGVAALCPLPELHRVALALDCGRLFLVTSQRPEAEGSFVLTELGAATELRCLTAVPRANCWEVWAGGSGLHVYSINSCGVSGADELADCAGVALMDTAQAAPYVLIYSEPGCCVSQWSVRTRKQTARLDCSKLAPCSETLQSLALDTRLDETHARVTAMCTMKGELYVGTAWGCVVVAEAATLRPITVFRPYETMVRAIVALQPLKGADSGAMIATFGGGYRPLMHRFVPQAQASAIAANNTTSGSYCLLWRADDWQPD